MSTRCFWWHQECQEPHEWVISGALTSIHICILEMIFPFNFDTGHNSNIVSHLLRPYCRSHLCNTDALHLQRILRLVSGSFMSQKCWNVSSASLPALSCTYLLPQKLTMICKFMLPARDLAGAASTVNCIAFVHGVFGLENDIRETRYCQARAVHAPCLRWLPSW